MLAGQAGRPEAEAPGARSCLRPEVVPAPLAIRYDATSYSTSSTGSLSQHDTYAMAANKIDILDERRFSFAILCNLEAGCNSQTYP